ncbi:MAG: hypothetical protein IJ789_07715 [Bacteroidales bacterium]|nr:hypothetical protein [Bacteroidales bacterium]
MLRSTEADLAETHRWMVAQYGFSEAEVDDWLHNYQIDWPLSVRAVDNEGHTLGLLTMSSYRIEQEAETMPDEAPQLLAELDAMRYTSVFSFIVAPQMRGSRLNYDMFSTVLADLEGYDFVFIPVMHHLLTHTYWRRWGARLFFEDRFCKYYLLPLSERARRLPLPNFC